MRIALALAAAAALALAGCSSDPNSDSRVNGMDRSKAAVECQKHLASKTPGVELGDFPTVGADGLRKVSTGGVEHWQVTGDLDGRSYTCRVTPTGEDAADVEGAFSL